MQIVSVSIKGVAVSIKTLLKSTVILAVVQAAFEALTWVVEKLADALDVSPAYLMCWTDDDGLDIRDTHPSDLTPRKGPSDFDKSTFESSEEIHSQNAFINYINSIGYEFIEPNKIKKGSVLVEITEQELLDLEEKSSNYTDELLMELIKKKIGL